MTFRAKLSVILGAVAVSAFGSGASAHSIQIFTVPSTSPAGGGNTNYTYQVFVTPLNQVNSGDFFTLVDVTGFVAVSSMPSGWSLVNSAGLAVTPAGAPGSAGGLTLIQTLAGSVGVLDSPTTPDLTFQYTGAPVGGAITSTSLGNFVITSTKNLFNLTGSTIVGSDHQSTDGKTGQNGDPYITPGDQAPPSFVPLPGSVWGGLSMLGALGAGRVIRRRRSIQARVAM